jgi:chromatin assembly factor 1 subunit A
LHGSDSEKEKETYDDNYELDDDFFVPHGHLSEEEMQEMDDDMADSNTPEVQKAKLKILRQEFAAEMSKKTEKIKPRLIGCIWMNGDEDENGCSKTGNYEKKYHCSDIIWRILKAREMMSGGEEIKLEEFEPEIAEPDEENEEKIVKTPAQKKAPPKIDSDSVKEFIRLIHGNVNGKKYIIREFQAYRLKTYYNQPGFQEFFVKSVEEKMTEISDYKSCPEEGPLFGKKCWYVKPDAMKEHFGEEKLTLPNQWTYILEKEKKPKPSNNGNANGVENSKKSSRDASPEESGVLEKVNEMPSTSVCESPKPSIVKNSAAKNSPATPVSRVLKPKESPLLKPKTPTSAAVKPKESPKVPTPTSSSKTNPQNSGKKRVALIMSVQRGQSINEEKKNTLISKFLQSNQKPTKETNGKTGAGEDVIEIID